MKTLEHITKADSAQESNKETDLLVSDDIIRCCSKGNVGESRLDGSLLCRVVTDHGIEGIKIDSVDRILHVSLGL